MIGVYLLKQDDEVVYVGQSVDIKNRIKAHKKDGKDFTNYISIECCKNLLNSTEEAYILLFNPKLNIRRAEIKTGKRLKVYESQKGMKIVQLEDDIHAIAKDKARKLGMTLRGYLIMLIKKDNK